MPGYAINEGMFQIPDGWEDKTVTLLSYPAGSAKPAASVTVTRERLPGPPPTLKAYVDAQLEKLATALGSFHLLQRTQIELDGQPTECMEFTWKTPERAEVRQLMAVIFWGSYSLVLTTTAGTDVFANWQPVFQDILTSFRVRPLAG